MSFEARSAEYREKIQFGMLDAIKPLHLKRGIELVVEAIARGVIDASVMMGEAEVEAFQKAGLLYPLAAIGGDLKKDGRKDILESPVCAETFSPWRKLAFKRWRVTGYRFVAPGEIVVWNTEDVIKLEVARIGLENDYSLWNLSRLVVNQNGESKENFDDGKAVYVRRVGIDKSETGVDEYRGKIKHIQVPQTIGQGSISVLEIHVPAFDGKGDVLDKKRGEYGELSREPDGQPKRDESGNYKATFPGPPPFTAIFPESSVGIKYFFT